MKRLAIVLMFVLAILCASPPPVQAGPLRRIGYRLTHPFAPIGSYAGPRVGDGSGVFGRRYNGGNQAPAGGGCANGSCSRP